MLLSELAKSLVPNVVKDVVGKIQVLVLRTRSPNRKTTIPIRSALRKPAYNRVILEEAERKARKDRIERVKEAVYNTEAKSFENHTGITHQEWMAAEAKRDREEAQTQREAEEESRRSGEALQRQPNRN